MDYLLKTDFGRTKAYRLSKTRSKLRRKTKIYCEYYGISYSDLTHTEKGKLRKGKIHCSCHMCSKKSRLYTKHSDYLALLSMNDSEKFYFTQD